LKEVEASLENLLRMIGFNQDQAFLILDTIAIGISITTDLSCKKIWHNRRAAEFLRIDPGESLARTLNQRVKFYHDGKKLAPAEMPIPLAAWNGNEAKGQEIEFLWDDGVRKYASINSNPIFSNDGKIIGAIVISEDITTEKCLHEKEKEFGAIFDLVSIGIAQVDTQNGQLLRFNDRFREITGYTDEELLTKTFLELTHPEDRDKDWELFSRALRGEDQFHRNEKRYIRKDGSIVWVRLNTGFIRDVTGKPIRTVSVCEDITDQKQMEKSLRESEERYRYLAEQLQEADYRKDEFLGILSHEIRNPLAAIKMCMYLLDRAKEDGEKAMMAKDIMSRQVTQLSRLIDDLLDVTRINRNKIVLQKKRVELTDFVQKAMEDYHECFKEKEVRLEARLGSTPLYLEADEVRLAQIVGNLLHNAAKFTPEGGIVNITVNRVEQNAVIQVKDNGDGMTPEVMDTLFTPFMQANKSLSRGEDSGLGLGLVLVKGLTELHGGTVSALSEGPGKGSVFTVCLPLAGEATPSVIHEAQPAAPFRRRRILVVEDIRDVALSLKRLLESEGHEVRVAYNGTECIAVAKEFRPDILLCDIGLPGMDGYQVASAFRADQELKSIFLVSVTGYARPKDLERAKKAGFQLHIAKPVDLSKLRQALADVE
jgi:PAS domain S-box-containing protein